MLTASFMEATAVELGPLPVIMEVDYCQEKEVAETMLMAIHPDVSEENHSFSIFNPTEIYASLNALLPVEKPTAIFEDKTWTSFNTFDLPPLELGTLNIKPPLLAPDSQKSIF